MFFTSSLFDKNMTFYILGLYIYNILGSQFTYLCQSTHRYNFFPTVFGHGDYVETISQPCGIHFTVHKGLHYIIVHNR